MFDLQVPFFKPLWIRVLVTVICLGWAGFEFLSGSTFWGMIFGGLGAYAAYQFFVVWNPIEDVEDEEEDT